MNNSKIICWICQYRTISVLTFPKISLSSIKTNMSVFNPFKPKIAQERKIFMRISLQKHLKAMIWEMLVFMKVCIFLTLSLRIVWTYMKKIGAVLSFTLHGKITKFGKKWSKLEIDNFRALIISVFLLTFWLWASAMIRFKTISNPFSQSKMIKTNRKHSRSQNWFSKY